MHTQVYADALQFIGTMVLASSLQSGNSQWHLQRRHVRRKSKLPQKISMCATRSQLRREMKLSQVVKAAEPTFTAI